MTTFAPVNFLIIMAKRARLTSDSLNCYGTRILTAGIDTSLFEKNPVLLWMHQRGTVVGYVNDLQRSDGELTGEPVFDGCTELSRQLEQQWNFGSLRMVSVSVDITEMSDDPQYLVQGQRYPTITKSKLTEVSIVDIGGNDDAVVLYRDGKKIELSAGGMCDLPMLNLSNKNNMNEELKKLAATLGLPETASVADIGEKIAAMEADAEAQKTALAEATAALEKMNLEKIEALVDGAIKEQRLAAEKKDEFVELGKTVGADKLASVIGAMNPQVKLSDVIRNAQNGGQATEAKKLSDLKDDEKIALRKDNPEKYAELYKAEYGVECSFNQESDED